MDNEKNNEVLNLIKKNIASCQMGLTYAHNPFDEERYTELIKINQKILSLISDNSLEDIYNFYVPTKEYITPKVEIRGFLLNEEDKILMVKEKFDIGKWSIPGGWADIGFSPSEVMKKEMKEETGLDVEVQKVLAIYDKRFHKHPKNLYYTYTIVFLCKRIGGDFSSTFEIEDVNYFDIDNLPSLSEVRILEEQIKKLYLLAKSEKNLVDFD